VIRWAGLGGSVATAVTAYLGGAGPQRLPSVNPGTLLGGGRGVVLPVCWVLGTATLIAAWWFGRHVVPGVRWALVTVALWWLPVLPFLPLGSADVYSYACQGWVQQAGGDPYAAGVAGSGCPWLSSVASSWVDAPAPYGPLFLLLAGGVVAVAGASLDAVVAGLRLIAVAGLALTAAGVPALARRVGVDPARAVWLVLACPLVLVHLVSGAHNDALLIGLTVAGLAVACPVMRPGAQSSSEHQYASGARLITAGLLLGLAVSVKATAVVVVPFAVLAAAPPRSALRALWRPAALIGGGLLAAAAVVSVLSGRGLGWVAGLLRSGDTVAWTSPSTAVGLTAELLGAPAAAITVTRAIGLVVLAVLLVVLWLRAHRGTLIGAGSAAAGSAAAGSAGGGPSGAGPAGAGLALAAVVLCAPVFHPWYATWPLAVLAATVPHSAPAGRWLLGLCALAATLTTPAGYNWALYTRVPGALAMTAAVLVLVVLVVRRSTRPSAVPA
jgi:hypothetical protein